MRSSAAENHMKEMTILLGKCNHLSCVASVIPSDRRSCALSHKDTRHRRERDFRFQNCRYTLFVFIAVFFFVIYISVYCDFPFLYISSISIIHGLECYSLLCVVYILPSHAHTQNVMSGVRWPCAVRTLRVILCLLFSARNKETKIKKKIIIIISAYFIPHFYY